MNKFDKERKIFSIVVDDLSKQNSNKTEFVNSKFCKKYMILKNKELNL